VTVTSLRLISLPLPPRSTPVRRGKPIPRPLSGRSLRIDKSTAGKLAAGIGHLPRISDMPLDCPVLIVGDGVPSFKVEHVGAALMARGARGFWLVEIEPRPRSTGSGSLAETLVGFPGLHIERLSSLADL
jgi:hypothetical protein